MDEWIQYQLSNWYVSGAKHFIHNFSLNPNNDPIRIISSLFFRWGNWESERIKTLSKIIQLINDGAGISAWLLQRQSPCSLITVLLLKRVEQLRLGVGRHSIEPNRDLRTSPCSTPLRGRATLVVCSWWCWVFTTVGGTVDLQRPLSITSPWYVLVVSSHRVLKSISLVVRADRCREVVPEALHHWQISENALFLEVS